MPNRNRKGARTFARQARPQGSDICTCPKCGHSETHPRGIPCNQVKCPKCGTLMTGEFC